MAGTDYRQSGVNLELGDEASQVLYNAAKYTWENRKGKLGEVVELFQDFSGLRAVRVGGLPGKLGRVLKPAGLGATIDDPFYPPAIMHYCQEAGGVSDREAYRTWNMGHGMVIVTPKYSAGVVMEIAKKHEIESRIIGEVSSAQGIVIESRADNAAREGRLVFQPDGKA